MTDPDLQSSGPSRTWSVFPAKPFISYAQNGEDVMLQRALRDVECGCYVDVGAAEPEVDSVTCAFYQRGWRGINLEPAPEAFRRLAAARPDDINLNLAVGDRNGVTQFFLVDGGNGLSTAVPTHMDSLREQGRHSTEIYVPVRTLTSIFAEHVDSIVHFLKIDAEGSERAVLAGADFGRFRPWIILVEATAPNSEIPTHLEWEDLLLSADYRFVWFDGLNRFYISAEKVDLAMAFNVQPNVFDGFVRHREVEAYALLTQVRSDLFDAVAGERRANEALHTAQNELAATRSREGELAAEVARVVAERDAWMQELFEADRYAAHLTQARQTVLDASCRLEEQMRSLQEEKAQLYNQILAMYSSTSWKFARPVRVVAKLFGRR